MKKNDRNEIKSVGSPHLTMHLCKHLHIMLGRTFTKMEPQPTKREKLLTKKLNSVGTNQPSGDFKTLPIDEKVTQMHNQRHWSFTLLNTFLSFFHAPQLV